MAEGFLQRKLEEDGLQGRLQVRSAGTWAAEDAPVSPNTLHAMSEHGIDLHSHRAHLLTVEEVQEADLVMVMEEDHRRVILEQLPEEHGKVLLLTEVAGRSGDVEDPYGSDLDSYRETALEVEALIDAAYPEILRQVCAA